MLRFVPWATKPVTQAMAKATVAASRFLLTPAVEEGARSCSLEFLVNPVYTFMKRMQAGTARTCLLECPAGHCHPQLGEEADSNPYDCAAQGACSAHTAASHTETAATGGAQRNCPETELNTSAEPAAAKTHIQRCGKHQAPLQNSQTQILHTLLPT